MQDLEAVSFHSCCYGYNFSKFCVQSAEFFSKPIYTTLLNFDHQGILH